MRGGDRKHSQGGTAVGTHCITNTHLQFVTLRVYDASSTPTLATRAWRYPRDAEASKPPQLTSANWHIRAAEQAVDSNSNHTGKSIRHVIPEMEP
jgi:hypothetical protein